MPVNRQVAEEVAHFAGAKLDGVAFAGKSTNLRIQSTKASSVGYEQCKL